MTEDFLQNFSSTAEKESALKQLKFVFGMVKQPNCKDNFKTINLTNEKFGRIRDSNAKFLSWLDAVGFTEADDASKWRFVTDGTKGNIQSLEHVMTLI